MKISVVVPIFNEEATILDTLDMLDELEGDKEVVLVDGGSTDKTIELIGDRAKLVKSPKGRAKQMNQGAEVTTGEAILFLHCDSKVGRSILKCIGKALMDTKVIGGGCTLEIDDPRFIFKIISFGSNLRPKMSGIFFGDQGIFVRREAFKRVGGFPDIELMEEWEFCRKLKKVGKLVQLPERIVTSARRWHKNGIWKTIWIMHKLKALYLRGVPPEELNRIYRDAR
ncbi:MAG: hypothetical protein APF84_05405 [Gracilibacter sp. BRH_c7a]|nr:MAG: hypothetical protein APF84_05405 [Gracilibacter sp. BRH_c7a]